MPALYVGGGLADLAAVAIPINVSGEWTLITGKGGGCGSVDRRGSLCYFHIKSFFGLATAFGLVNFGRWFVFG